MVYSKICQKKDALVHANTGSIWAVKRTTVFFRTVEGIEKGLLNIMTFILKEVGRPPNENP